MDKDTSLMKIFQIVKKRAKTFLIVFISLLAITLGSVFLLNKSFAGSRARLLVGTETEKQTGEYNNINGEPIYEEVIKYGGSSISEESVVFYSEILNNEELLEELINVVNLDYSISELREGISIKVPEKSSTLLITVGSEDIENPDQIVEKLVNLFKEKVFEITEVDQIKILSTHSEPIVIGYEGISRNIIASIIISIFVAGSLVLVVEYLDDSVQTAKDIEEKLGIFVIGQLESEVALEEDFKKIRTSFEHSIRLKDKNIITIAGLDEKYNNVSVDFSNVLGEIKKEVLLVDADLRSPAIHEKLDLSNELGLSNVLKSRVSLEDSIQSYKEHNYKVLTAGSELESPSEQLSSCNMEQLVNDLRTRFDYVVINGHSINEVTDTIALSTATDGIVLLAKENKTKLSEIKAIQKTLIDIDVEILGVIYSKI